MRRTLVLALFLCAISGFLLHYRIHPFLVPDKIHPGMTVFNGTTFLAFLLPLIDMFVVTALYLSRKTALYGYLLNGLLVIYGTILMGHFSIAQFIAQSVPPDKWIINSTLPDIGIAWADFFVGKALYDLYLGKPFLEVKPRAEG
ncbi:MAG TPA: hypothetical protein VGJ94_10430 [Syntrophorhabdaceae bacterium]|jgi:hypothetical protein